ncbi:hypothetical protein CRYUN_Cryun07bG0182900 [Craigia yunnanensis]
MSLGFGMYLSSHPTAEKAGVIAMADASIGRAQGFPTAGGGGNVKGTSSREVKAKSTVTEQISQALQFPSNLLHLMQQSSPSQTQLMKLPKNLLAKTPTIKNTGQMLEQMPRVISLLDAHINSPLQSVPHLKTVIQLLENMESCQLSYLSQTHFSLGIWSLSSSCTHIDASVLMYIHIFT